MNELISRYGNSESALQEYQLVATFLATNNMQDIHSAIHWIQVYTGYRLDTGIHWIQVYTRYRYTLDTGIH